MIISSLRLDRVRRVLVVSLLILIFLELVRRLLPYLWHYHSLVYLRIALRLLITYLRLMHAHLLALVECQNAL